MKIPVKILKVTHFNVDANPEETVADVKKSIESLQGQSAYPAEQQMLIHQGKILNDETTLQDNNVSENSFLVILLRKVEGSSSGASTASAKPTIQGIREQEETPLVVPAALTEQWVGTPVEAPQTAQTAVPSSEPNAIPLNLFPQKGIPSTGINTGVCGLDFLRNRSKVRALQALVQANPQVLQPMLHKLGKQTPHCMRLVQELQAEFLRLVNEPAEGEERNLLGQSADAMPQALTVTPKEREAIEQGIPSTGINTGVDHLGFLRNSSQFRALQALVQANPQVLQPMLQELGKQNPHVMRLIQEHQAEFLRLINEPAEGEERNLLADAMPQALTVTHEECEAIERLEAMGFERSLVLQVFFACNRNEELTTNYLLDHLHEFEDDQ